jgi:YbgC/YbaW family acyl-CoA thioester hydrolase
MTEVKKVLESAMKIRFHDCDPFNHLNNSRYIDYIMAARGDQLIDNYGFDIYKLSGEQAVSWVSAHTQISYLAPVFLGEEVIVRTQLLSCTDKSLLVEGVMLNNDKTVIKAILWAKLVHFNLKTQKSNQHSEELIQFFQQIVNPLPAETNFEQRIKALKNEKADLNCHAVS